MADWSAHRGTRPARWRWIVALALICGAPLRAGADDVLLDYVRTPDPAFRYRPVEVVQRPGCTVHVLEMVSQSWRTRAEVNRVLWRHWLAVVVPHGVHGDAAMLIVEGGANLPFRPSVRNPVVKAAEHIARTTGTAVIVLGQVPNEPLSFPDSAGALVEDELVAYSWAKAMNTGDYTWPAYVPMVKSVVRAMDAVQHYMDTSVAHPVKRFVLLGFSKRGAAAWLTAAVDARVVALASGVFDVLDIVSQIEHHYAAYGFYAQQLHAYLDYGVVRRLRAPEGAALLRVVDPYYYLDRVTQPKLLVNGTGDPFFLPDAARQYFGRLRGETLFRYVPNADHSLHNRTTHVMDIVDGVVSWYRSLLTNTARPQIRWIAGDDRLWVQSTPVPIGARLWHADNPQARDFRKQTIGQSWRSEPLALAADGSSVAMLPKPERGWSADFIELSYPGMDHLPQVFTTPVFVRPDIVPFALAEPIRQPRDESYWAEQLARAARGDLSAELNAWTLAKSFPLPLFDRRLPDVAAAAQVMADADDAGAQARRACLAVRINIARGELGWYSRLVSAAGDAHYLWEIYADADQAYRQGQPQKARDLCRSLCRASTIALSGGPGATAARTRTPENPRPSAASIGEVGR